jgi:hypothetical protein
MASWRTAIGQMITRNMFAGRAGITYRGKRDTYEALGYKKLLTAIDFRQRFNRNGIANRLVKAMPDATWKQGFEVIEDEDPTTETPFEKLWDAFDTKHKLTSKFRKGDILSGIGRFGVLVIGLPGAPNTPVERVASLDDIAYFMAYSEETVSIFQWDLDPTSPRYGRPLMYQLQRVLAPTPGNVSANTSISIQVHWTRILHLADGLLDDEAYGEPRLQAVWNYIDDLEKISGGGAEAYWRRADGGTQWDLDPEIEIEGEDDDSPDTANPEPSAKKAGIKKQIDEMEHGLRRNIFTRGVTMNRMGSDVAPLKDPVDTVIGLISASTGIPQRVFMGSEQGKLAAQADRSNWDDKVAARRDDYAGPMIVRVLVDRLIGWGALPKPAVPYQVRWSQIRVMDDLQRAQVASEWAGLNKPNGPVVVLPDEIRRILGLGALDDAGSIADVQMMPNAAPKGGVKAPLAARKFGLLSLAQQKEFIEKKLVAAGAKPNGAVHRAADRFAPKFRKAARAAFAEGRAALDMDALRQALEAKDEAATLELVSSAITATEEALKATVPSVILQTMTDAASTPLRLAWVDKETGLDDHGRDAGKVARAKESHVPMTKDKLAKATEREQAIVKAIGGEHIGGTKPFDVVIKDKSGKMTHAVEVKTIFGKNDKITMHKSSLKRKEAFARKHGLKTHTIAIDARGRSDAYHHREGLGSFRLKGMDKVGRHELHGRVRG